MKGFLISILLYQSLLMIMGIIIFIVLVFLLIWSVIKKRSFVTLLPFFLIPVIMVAFPTLRSVKIGDIVINVKKLTAIVNNNPADTGAGNQLEKSVEQLKATGNLARNGDALLAVANAQIALGKYDSAALYLNKAGQTASQPSEIISAKKELNHAITLNQNFSHRIQELNRLIENLKKRPDDTAVLHEIGKTLSTLQVPHYITSQEAETLAKAQAVSHTNHRINLFQQTMIRNH